MAQGLGDREILLQALCLKTKGSWFQIISDFKNEIKKELSYGALDFRGSAEYSAYLV